MILYFQMTFGATLGFANAYFNHCGILVWIPFLNSYHEMCASTDSNVIVIRNEQKEFKVR